jgi:hypothetical protein
MSENRYLVTFYKNNVKTITMEKFAASEEEAISKCIEKAKSLDLQDKHDRHEVVVLPKKEFWE